MTKANIGTIIIFLSILLSVICGVSLWDVYLKITDPSGDDTISWSMTLLGYSNPMLVFILGHLTGGVLWGLIAHFWANMPTPEQWNDFEATKAENEKLQLEVDELQKKLCNKKPCTSFLASVQGRIFEG